MSTIKPRDRVRVRAGPRAGQVGTVIKVTRSSKRSGAEARARVFFDAEGAADDYSTEDLEKVDQAARVMKRGGGK